LVSEPSTFWYIVKFAPTPTFADVTALNANVEDRDGNLTGEGDCFATPKSVAEAPVSDASNEGAAIVPLATGNGGTAVVGSDLDGTGGGGTCPTALAGETTPRTNAIETKPAKAILRGNEDNRDSNRELEAQTSDQPKAVLTGNWRADRPVRNEKESLRNWRRPTSGAPLRLPSSKQAAVSTCGENHDP
jgi:hypothetical protein